jgi:hypothetical protein
MPRCGIVGSIYIVMESEPLHGQETRLVVLRIQEITRPWNLSPGNFRSEELNVGINLVNGLGYSIIDYGELLYCDLVFEIGLVQNIPIVDFVVVTGLVEFPHFVLKAALRIPLEDSSLVFGYLATARILQQVAAGIVSVRIK